MAPSRKSKSVNKKFSYVNEVASSKDGVSSSKRSGKRKRKLSDMLGPHWTKKELERFYEAYRKYGNDWKKVATMIRNRSVQMVEALYTMNRAYLFLPEGTATMVGLIAMMTDHYSVMSGILDSINGAWMHLGNATDYGNEGGSDSEQESNEGMGVSRKPQKPSRGKLRDQPSKKSRPRAVGKRTPHVPISFSHDKSKAERYFSLIRQGMKLKEDSVDDDVAHEVALALTEASQRGGSPQVSRTPNRKAETPSLVINSERMNADSETTSAKIHGSEVDEDACELSLGSTEADYADYARDKNYSRIIEGTGTVEVHQKGKRYLRRKPEVEESVNNHLEDTKEACSGTEEGQQLCDFKGKFNAEVADAKTSRALIKGPRKRSKKVLFEVEDTSFDALQTLADLSLMMPETAPDTESSVQFKEDKNEVEKTKLKGNHPVPGAKGNASRTSRHGKNSGHDVRATAEAKEETHPGNVGMQKRRQKSSPYKSQIPKDENDDDSQLGESPNIEVSDRVKNLLSKGKRSNNIGHPKQGKSLRPPEHASSSTDKVWGLNSSGPSTIHVSSVNQVNLPTKVRSKRKMDAQKPAIRKDIQSDNIEKLCNFLNSYLARRWCIFEWFYSTIDYPWFAKREFVEYLDHVGLGHIPRLTRVEWGVIRSSLGKPRRFSEQFLKEEREKLNQYRESVRRHYTELRAGIGEGLPTDLARPLSVGQRDIDCMPLNPLENLPAYLLRQNAGIRRLVENHNELKMNGQSEESKMEENIKFMQCDSLENASPSRTSPSTFGVGNLSQPVDSSSPNLQLKTGPAETVYSQQAMNSQPSALLLAQSREADVEALSQLTRALDKKEAVVSELRRMNDEVLENQKGGDNYLKNSDSFKKQYADVLLQLNEVYSALFCLRQRNTYQGASSGKLLKPLAKIGGEQGSHLSSFGHAMHHVQESVSHAAEIVESSKRKARSMVDAAVQNVFIAFVGWTRSDQISITISGYVIFAKRGESIEVIEEAIDFVNNQLSLDEFSVPVPRSAAPTDSIRSHDHPSYPSATSHIPEMKLQTLSDQDELRIPSDLISQCVATLPMIHRNVQKDSFHQEMLQKC
ncbi:Always early, putative isoform 3 [Hibiscus syriacus]|uniref:Always early, putative isoform 3 n=1 Tax=Hibiscus syriacus TaxID=106335 RepID=A0A6A2XMK4_HIBSY|nr:Always early, putative isoform 3 [Hibiscus syriacus]